MLRIENTKNQYKDFRGSRKKIKRKKKKIYIAVISVPLVHKHTRPLRFLKFYRLLFPPPYLRIDFPNIAQKKAQTIFIYFTRLIKIEWTKIFDCRYRNAFFLSRNILRPFFRNKNTKKKKTLFFQFLFFINIPHFLEIIKTHHIDKKSCMFVYKKNVEKKKTFFLLMCLWRFIMRCWMWRHGVCFKNTFLFWFRLMIQNLNNCFLSLFFYTFIY